MKQQTLTFEAIGTRWSIQAQTNPSTDWQKLEGRIHARIETFDAAYSRFRSDSLVTRMAKEAGSYDLPSDGFALLQFYEQLYRATDGKLTPLIGQVISDAGYDAEYSLKPKELHEPPKWEEVISYDEGHIKLAQPALLDFGAAGKGYLIDIIADMIVEAGLTTFFINAGGDIVYRTDSPARLNVGLENPNDHSEVIGTASILNQSICASSGSRRQWGKYHHIIDPQKLESPQAIIATWAVADRALQADGLATALYFTDPQKLRERFTFSYAILRKDMTLEYSHDFPTILNELSK